MRKIHNNNLVKDRKISEQAELIDYLKEQNDIQQQEIRELTETNIDLEKKLLSYDLNMAKASNETEEHEKKNELLQDRIKYLEKAIKNYQQLPDLKNMIDNLSSLTTPNIDKLADIMSSNQFEGLDEIVGKIDLVRGDIDRLRDKIDGTHVIRMF